MNLVDNPYALQSNEAEMAFNVDLGIRDVLSSRKGFSEAGLAGEVLSQTKVAGEGVGASWSNPNNITAEGAGSASEHWSFVEGSGAEAFGGELRSKKHGFSLPENAVPVGVKVRIRGSWEEVGGGTLQEVYLSTIRLFKANVAAGTAKTPHQVKIGRAHV